MQAVFAAPGDAGAQALARPAPSLSLPPGAVRLSEARFCHASDPPVTAGADGAVRSMSTVPPAAGDAGAHADRRPDTSMARNWTMVVPAAVTDRVVPVVAA